MAKSSLLAFDVVIAGTKYSLGELSGELCCYYYYCADSHK